MVNQEDRSIAEEFPLEGRNTGQNLGGHSISNNWPTTCVPKVKGGLGILDLERFARALRLRCLLFQWRLNKRAWNRLDLPCDGQDKELLVASTVVTIGDGKLARFWTSSWVDGTTPKSLTPTLIS